MAEALRRRSAEILVENAEDVAQARKKGLRRRLIDRLCSTRSGCGASSPACATSPALPDPVGEVVDGWRLPQRPRDRRCACRSASWPWSTRRGPTSPSTRRRCASRPATPSSCAAAATPPLQPHPGRGHQGAVSRPGLPATPSSYLSTDREELVELLKQREYVDLVIPRGGEELKEFLLEHSQVPVIYAAGGNCHVYVDAAADLDKALDIIINAKCQRPGVCNAAETLLVHQGVAAEFLPRAAEAQAARRGARRRQGGRRRPSATRAQARQQDALRDGVPRAEDGRARGRLARRGRRAHRHVRHAALRGHRHRDLGGRAALHARGRRGRRLRQRLHPLHRRRRVRPGRRDRHLHPEAARARADGAQELTSVKYVVWGDGQVRG